MKTDYLTIKQAAKYSDRSTVTIRRAIKQLLTDNPNTPHVQQKQLSNGQRQYFISKQHISRIYAPPEQTTYTRPAHAYMQDAPVSTELITQLQKQNAEQKHIIDNLLERQRETNILLQSYQTRLLMSDTQTVRQAHKKHRFLWFNRST